MSPNQNPDQIARNVPPMKLDPLTLTAVFEPASDGGFTWHFEELPEVFSHRDEARARTTKGALRESLRLVPT